jgi:hypothetical protein
MKFIEVEVTGGLGNQLFKWSNGLRIAQELNATLILNTSFYKRLKNTPETSKRIFELNQIQLINETFIEIKQRGFLYPRLQKIGESTKLIQIVNEESLSISERTPYFLVKGNFESFKYLPDRDSVREMFQSGVGRDWLAEHQEFVLENQVIAIHIRLGDFLAWPEIYNILPEDYYLEAIKIARVHFPHSSLWLFTDDEIGAEKLFPTVMIKIDKIIASSDIPPRETLNLMSKANAIICANSTFSWWASFLAESDTVSIIPSKFNKISGDMTAENLRMPSQIVLPV